MAIRSTIALLSTILLAPVALSCERPQDTVSRDSTTASSQAAARRAAQDSSISLEGAPVEALQPASVDDRTMVRSTPISPRDSALVFQAAQAFASRSLYLHWAPNPGDRTDPVCFSLGDGGSSPNADWGLARARVRRVSLDDSTGATATADLEVIRVLSIEGDPDPSGDRDAEEEVMFVAPIRDRIELDLRRRPDGRWIPCHVFTQGEVAIEIALTGPPADTLAPRGKKLGHVVPKGATWQRVRALADSVARAERAP
jgi:hypothetical protein